MSRGLDIRRRRGEPKSLISLLVEEERGRRRLDIASGAESARSEEERWRIEAEVLRAECKFLRMERDLAFRKLEENQGRKKVDRSRRLMVVDVSTQRRRRRWERSAVGSNFDRNASVVRRQLAANDHPHADDDDDVHVEMLRRKMEGMSRGMLQKVEECGSLLSQSASGSGRNGHSQRQAQGTQQPGRAGPGSCCCNCKCKQVVARIAEQVKAEKQHWSEMQEMLGQVRVEMEDLRSSRDHWQSRAVASELELRALRRNIMEWEQKAQASEKNVTEPPQQQQQKPRSLKTSRGERLSTRSSGRSVRADDWDAARLPKIRCHQQQQERRMPDCASREKEKEKRVLICHLHGSRRDPASRAPLRDVGNSSPMPRKCSAANR